MQTDYSVPGVITNESVAVRLAKVIRGHYIESNLPYGALAEEVAMALDDNLKIDPCLGEFPNGFCFSFGSGAKQGYSNDQNGLPSTRSTSRLPSSPEVLVERL